MEFTYCCFVAAPLGVSATRSVHYNVAFLLANINASLLGRVHLNVREVDMKGEPLSFKAQEGRGLHYCTTYI